MLHVSMPTWHNLHISWTDKSCQAADLFCEKVMLHYNPILIRHTSKKNYGDRVRGNIWMIWGYVLTHAVRMDRFFSKWMETCSNDESHVRWRLTIKRQIHFDRAKQLFSICMQKQHRYWNTLLKYTFDSTIYILIAAFI